MHLVETMAYAGEKPWEATPVLALAGSSLRVIRRLSKLLSKSSGFMFNRPEFSAKAHHLKFAGGPSSPPTPA